MVNFTLTPDFILFTLYSSERSFLTPEAKVMLGDLLFRLSERVQKRFRWQGEAYTRHLYKQSTAAHSLEMVWLGTIALELERTYRTPDNALNEALILQALAWHDVTEGTIGDILHSVKNDPRVRDGLKAIEQEHFQKIVAQLPKDAREGVTRAHELQNDKTSPEGRFFKALEYLEYMMYAWREYEHGHKEYKQVFMRQHENFTKFSSEFRGLQELFEPYKSEIEQILE